MKSRRRIALPKAGTTPSRTQLQQGFATGETGFGGQFAQQQSCAPHVRFGSKADIDVCRLHVRFTPKSGHRNSLQRCPLCANSGHDCFSPNSIPRFARTPSGQPPRKP